MRIESPRGESRIKDPKDGLDAKTGSTDTWEGSVYVQKENPETIAKFYEQFFTNKVAAIRTIIKMAEERGFTFSAEEVQNYVRTMNENEEFADIELTKLL